jgi:STE24 endopeptidase
MLFKGAERLTKKVLFVNSHRQIFIYFQLEKINHKEFNVMMETNLLIILAVYIVIVIFGYALEWLNIRYLKEHGTEVPSEFEGSIDRTVLSKTQDYLIDNTRFGIFSSIFNNIILLVFLFGGFLDSYNYWVQSLNFPFIVSGLVFFVILSLGETILSIPFTLYHTFWIESKYGFNTMTLGLWIVDLIKSVIISTIIMAIVISAALALIQWSPDLWWLDLWGFFFIFSFFIMYIAPYVIEPLFNKFTPLEGSEDIKTAIVTMMEKVNIRVSRIFKMDASKRSRHTNAYFTGIGKNKRIVLYDTLIEKMTSGEILAVLAHEVGHWKKKHLLKRILLSEIIALGVLYLAHAILGHDYLSKLFNITSSGSTNLSGSDSTFFAEVVILAFLGIIVSFPFTPFSNIFSRQHEKEADSFCYELTQDTDSMISALVKLSKDNLSNLHPHPFYAAFHYSHPPVTKRIGYIKKLARKDSDAQEEEMVYEGKTE